MRILFIHEVSYQSKFVFEMHEFPELLALQGHSVAFLEFAEDRDSWVPRLKSQLKEIKGRVHHEADIHLYTPGSFGKGIFGRLFATLSTPFTLKRAIREEKPDVIVLYAVPTSGWQTVMQAHRKKVPIVFRALDVSHELRPTVFRRLVLAAEKYIYRRVEILSANNPALAEYCINLVGRTAPTVVNLPPLQLSDFEGSLSRAPLAKFGISQDEKVILYMGSFFRFSGLDNCLIKFSKYAQYDQKLRLVLVGGGELDRALRVKVKALGLSDKVTFTGVVEYSQLGPLLRAADVAINPFNPEFLTCVALPHKMFQYMASGVPTVSTSLDGIRGVLGENSGVTWVDSSASVIDAAIELVAKSDSDKADISHKQLARVHDLFRSETVLNDFLGTLEKALKQGRNGF